MAELMKETRKGLLRSGLLVAAMNGFPWLACSEPPLPVVEAESLSFAAIGDAPYTSFEVERVERMIDELNGFDLDWVLHVGDILWYPCDDETIRGRFELFNRLRHPFAYTPGDNEWADCWERRLGAFDPLERLAFLRAEVFADQPDAVERPLAAASQSESAEWPEFVENRRWIRDDVLFLTVHMVGSSNAREPFRARTKAHDAEADRRTRAALAWLASGFELAERDGLDAVVIAFHASPDFRDSPRDPAGPGFESFLAALESAARSFREPILLVHGDDHLYIVDHPLFDPDTGEVFEHVTRLEVPGSPEVGYVVVEVRPHQAEPFRFQARRLPGRLGRLLGRR